jgi:hypothetical protein
MGRGIVEILLGLALSYLLARWQEQVDQERIKAAIAALLPEVQENLKDALKSIEAEFIELYQKDPQARIYLNITYRVGYESRFAAIGGYGETITYYYKTELVSADISLSPINTTSVSNTEKIACSSDSINWQTLPISEAIPISDLFTEATSGNADEKPQ